MRLALKILVHILACIIFLTGKTGFDYCNDFNLDPHGIWNNMYYLWDKLCYLLLVICITYPCRIMRPLFHIMIVIMLFRLIDEIPAIRDWQWWSDVHGMLFVDFACLIGFVVIMAFSMTKILKQVNADLKKGIPSDDMIIC